MKMKNNDIRICTSCHFLFEGNPNYGCCPDCGKPTIREADELPGLRKADHPGGRR